MNKFIICSLVFSLFSFKATYSQCCAAGNPVSGDCTAGDDDTKKLVISALYRHSFSDTYFDGDNISDYKYIDNSYFDFNSINISYNATDKLNIGVEAGYFLNKTQNFDFGASRKAFGIGDGALLLKYRLYNNENVLFSITPSFKLTLPIGVFDQMYGPVVLPIDIQPSSGNIKYNPGVLLKKNFKDSKISLYSYNAVEISNRIQTERTDYKYGNHYLFSLIGSYKLSNKVNTILQFRSQIREKAVNRDIVMNSTGGHVLFIAPQITYKFIKSWQLAMIFEKPIYKNMNGKQLTNKHAFVIKISRSIDLG